MDDSIKKQLLNEAYYYTIDPLIKLLDKSFRQIGTFPIGISESDDQYNIKEIRSIVKKWNLCNSVDINEIERLFNAFEKYGAHNYYVLMQRYIKYTDGKNEKWSINIFTRNELSDDMIKVSYDKDKFYNLYKTRKIYNNIKKMCPEQDTEHFRMENFNICIDYRYNDACILNSDITNNLRDKNFTISSNENQKIEMWSKYPKLNVIDPCGYYFLKLSGVITHAMK